MNGELGEKKPSSFRLGSTAFVVLCPSPIGCDAKWAGLGLPGVGVYFHAGGVELRLSETERGTGVQSAACRGLRDASHRGAVTT